MHNMERVAIIIIDYLKIFLLLLLIKVKGMKMKFY